MEQTPSRTAPRVVDIRKERYDLYIGRGKDREGLTSRWGNPFKMTRDTAAERERVIAAYQDWLLQGEGQYLTKYLPELEAKTLGCFCAPEGGLGADDPLRCHGQVLLRQLQLVIAGAEKACRRKEQGLESVYDAARELASTPGFNEARGDLWRHPAQLRCITTNAQTRRDGAAVMGRGCAREATQRIPGIEFKLGELLRQYGNRPLRLTRYNGADLATFPVKRHWKETADLAIISGSAMKLVNLANRFGYTDVVIPRPGCGNGSLEWERVAPVLGEVLDRRFTVITN